MGLRLPKCSTDFKMKQATLAKVATNIYTKMGSVQGLINFPVPAVALVDLVAAINTYTTSLAAAVKGSKDQTDAKDTSKVALINLLRTQAIYVDTIALQAGSNTSQNSQTNITAMKGIILSSGFLLSNAPGPVANNVGVAMPIIKKAISKNPGQLHLLLRQYTKYKKGVNTWYLQYRLSAVGVTPAGPWMNQTFTSGNIVADGLTSGKTYDWQVAGIGGHNTKLNSTNPVNFTNIQQIVIT